MKVYKARYVLNKEWKDKELISFFDFEQEEEGVYTKTDYGYFKEDGWLSCRLEDEIDAYNSLCCVISIKYFDRELDEEELKYLKEQMQCECVTALTHKKNKIMKDLDEQINFIVKQMAEAIKPKIV